MILQHLRCLAAIRCTNRGVTTMTGETLRWEVLTLTFGLGRLTLTDGYLVYDSY